MEETLQLSDRELIFALAGKDREQISAEHRCFEPRALSADATRASLGLICACDAAYPQRLRDLPSVPAVLYVAGGVERFLALASADPVAIVGSRRASDYGLQSARSLARGVARAGLTVVSGMAIGVDAAAHGGALEGGGMTVAVLAAGADRPYPPAKRGLYKRIVAAGAAVSELPPGVPIRRWMFPARNRIIAALAAATVVVEGAERSGALVTAARALDLDRPLGAVPGRVTSSLAAGPNGLIAGGAQLVRAPQDILEMLFGESAVEVLAETRDPIDPQLQQLLLAIGQGEDTIAALTRKGLAPHAVLASISALELAGYIRRAAGGRYEVLP